MRLVHPDPSASENGDHPYCLVFNKRDDDTLMALGAVAAGHLDGGGGSGSGGGGGGGEGREDVAIYCKIVRKAVRPGPRDGLGSRGGAARAAAGGRGGGRGRRAQSRSGGKNGELGVAGLSCSALCVSLSFSLLGISRVVGLVHLVWFVLLPTAVAVSYWSASCGWCFMGGLFRQCFVSGAGGIFSGLGLLF